MLFEHAHWFLSTTTFVPEAQVVERIWEVRKKAMADQSRLCRILCLSQLIHQFGEIRQGKDFPAAKGDRFESVYFLISLDEV